MVLWRLGFVRALSYGFQTFFLMAAVMRRLDVGSGLKKGNSINHRLARIMTVTELNKN